MKAIPFPLAGGKWVGSQEGVPLEGMAQVEAHGAQTHGHKGSEKDRMD